MLPFCINSRARITCIRVPDFYKINIQLSDVVSMSMVNFNNHRHRKMFRVRGEKILYNILQLPGLSSL